MTVLNRIGKQVAVVLLGLALAAVMIGLGVWQLGVYNAQGRDEAVKRAAQPAVSVTAVAPPGQEVTDEAYGRTVRFSGRYDPSLQTYIGLAGQPGHYRVLTGLRLTQGGVLPVVRGVVTGKDAPAPPSSTVTETGVLLPPEGTNAQPGQPGGEPTTIVLASLAQHWSGTLVNGYATLNAPEARAQSLQPAQVALPSSHGRLRNGFYALQWWVFAAFAVAMGVRMARDIGRADGGPAIMGAALPTGQRTVDAVGPAEAADSEIGQPGSDPGIGEADSSDPRNADPQTAEILGDGDEAGRDTTDQSTDRTPQASA